MLLYTYAFHKLHSHVGQLTIFPKIVDGSYGGVGKLPNYFRLSQFTSAVNLVQCDRIRRGIMELLHTFFAQTDLFFAPWSEEMNALTNLTGHPTLVLRSGFQERHTQAIKGITEEDTEGPKHKVPDSIHLWSGLFQEGKLITLGRALEEKKGVRLTFPQRWKS